METEKIRAILMRPGKEAQIIYVRPQKIEWIVGEQYKKCYPQGNGFVLLYRPQSHYFGKVRRGNRYIKTDSNFNTEIMYGDALAVGTDPITKEIRSLTDDEVMECMIDYRLPEFKDHVFYGLKSGDKITIKGEPKVEIYWQERKPDKIVVKKEYKYFISCEGIWRNGNKIRFSINKPFDNDHVFINQYTGEILR